MASAEKNPNSKPEDVSLGLVTLDDMNSALASTKSSSTKDKYKYEQWQKEFGSV